MTLSTKLSALIEHVARLKGQSISTHSLTWKSLEQEIATVVAAVSNAGLAPYVNPGIGYGPLGLHLAFLESDGIPYAYFSEKEFHLWEGRMFALLQADHQTSKSERRPKEIQLKARHSEDFRSVHWFGEKFEFTPNQAAVIAQLWKAWDNGTPQVGHHRLLTEAGIESSFKDLFKGHPARGRMLVPGTTKGTAQLKEPNPDQTRPTDSPEIPR